LQIAPKQERRIKASQTQLRAEVTRYLRQGQGDRNPQSSADLLARIYINSPGKLFVPVREENLRHDRAAGSACKKVGKECWHIDLS
jgi:hypothetical protein